MLMYKYLSEMYHSKCREIANELSYFCMVEDKRSQHIAEKFGFQYVKNFYGVQSND